MNEPNAETVAIGAKIPVDLNERVDIAVARLRSKTKAEFIADALRAAVEAQERGQAA